MLEWESLAEALQRVVSVGVGIEAAKKEICDHVAQDLIRARVLPAGSSQFLTGKMTVQVPPLLQPADLDWKHSRPKHEWHINPWKFRNWEKREISLLQLKTFDTDELIAEKQAVGPDEVAGAANEHPILKEKRRGPKTGKKDRAIQAMKADIEKGICTIKELWDLAQKELAHRYGVGRTTAVEARKAVAGIDHEF